MMLCSRFYRQAIFLVFLCALGIGVPVTGQTDGSGFNLERAQAATVLVIQAREANDQLLETCVGSGTLIWRDGLILTNAHIAVPSQVCDGDTLLIAISRRLDEPPIPSFRAEIVQVDQSRDLAILQIRRELDGRSLNPDDLILPYVELGDSNDIKLDETITILGYEGIGDRPIQSPDGPLRGSINGFLAETVGGERAWLKTTVSVPGVMSGGGAYDKNGQLIGIPISSPALTESGVQCVTLRDVNGDRLVDDADSCIPISSGSNALRPIQMARPLLRAASLGLQVESLQGTQVGERDVAPSVSRLFFAASVREGQPSSVIESLPANATGLYLFFDYQGMRQETVYELRVLLQGLPNSALSLPPLRWSGQSDGSWYIGSSGWPLSSGRYQFTLFIDGQVAASRSIEIGVSQDDQPVFTDIVFGLAQGGEELVGSGYLLPLGEIATARFIHRNMRVGMPWQVRWYYEGVLSSSSEGEWLDEANGVKAISIRPEGGLLPGRYRLELGIENRLAATADFLVAGLPSGILPRVYTELQFVGTDSRSIALTGLAANTFSSGISGVFARWNWHFVKNGTPWRVLWLVDDEVFYEEQAQWSSGDNGSGRTLLLGGREQIPDGRYRLELELSGVVVASAEFVVGIGQLPIEAVSLTRGVRLRGQVVDAETGDGIAGASFILISEDFAVSDWEWDEAQIFDRTRSDSQGNFQLDRNLRFRTPYSVYVTSRGYLPVTGDNFTISEETVDPLVLFIELVRDRP